MTRILLPLPVAGLTMRQFLGGKAVRVVALLALIPVAFGLIHLIRPELERPVTFLGEVIFLELMIPTLLPLTILVLAIISRNATTIRLNAPASLGKPYHPE